jgi:hypothetical protein
MRQQGGKTLADFDRQTRTALVGEVLGEMLQANFFTADVLDEDVLREVATRLDVPFMALHLLVDGRVTADDMREWCGKAVA